MKIVYILLSSLLLVAYGVVWRRVVRRSPGLTPLLGWMAGLGFFVVAPLLIMTVNGGFTLPAFYGVDRSWASVDLSNPAFFLPYLVVWVSLMSCCFVIYLFSTREPNLSGADADLSRSVVRRSLWVTFAFAVCYWIFTIGMAGGVEQFLVSHWYTRDENLAASYGDAYVLLTHFASANQVIFTAAAALYTGMALKTRKVSWMIMFTIIFELLGETLVSGNRISIAIYLLSVFTSCWVHERTRVLVGMLAVTPVLVLVFSLWASIRGNLSELGDRTNAYFEADRGNRIVTSLMDVTEGADAMILFHIIRDFGKDFPCLYGQSYFRTFTSLIPRRVYANKSETFPTILAEVYVPGEVTSLNATALGEMYANFGPASIVLMPLLTLGVLCLSDWSVRTRLAHPLRPAVLFVLAMGTARVTVEDNIVLFILITIVISLARLEIKRDQRAVRVPMLSVS